METTILLKNRNFVLLAQGVFVTKMGSAGFFIAVTLALKSLVDSGSIMALIIGISTVPTILFSAYGGLMADKHSPPRVMVLSDLFSGIASITLPVVFIFSKDVNLKLAMILVTATLHSASQAFFDPASKSLLSHIVKKADLLKANSNLLVANHLSTIIGQTAAGFVYAVIGPVFLFIFDGISYFLSAISEAFIKIRKNLIIRISDKQESAGIIKNFIATWQLSKDVEGLRSLFLLEIFVNFISAPTIIYLTFLTQNHLGLHPSWYSWFLAFLTIGGITGSFIARKLKGQSRFHIVVLALFVISISKLIIAQSRITFLSMFLLFIEANLYTIIAIFNMTTIQEKVDKEILGRIFGIKDMFNRASVPLGIMTGGIFVDLFKKNMTIVFSINGIALLIVTLLFAFYPQFKSFFNIAESRQVHLPDPGQ